MGGVVHSRCHGARLGRCSGRVSRSDNEGRFRFKNWLPSSHCWKFKVFRLTALTTFAAWALTQGATDQVLETMLERPQTLRIDAVAEEDENPLLGFVLSSGGSHWRPRPAQVLTSRAQRSAVWHTGRVSRSGLHSCIVSGRATSLFGLYYELMTIFAHGYFFACRFQHEATRVWPSGRLEFKRDWALLPLCVARLDRAWDDVDHACDASSLWF